MNHTVQSTLIAVAILLSAAGSNAQTDRSNSDPKPGVRISVGANFLTPTGSFRSNYTGGYGAFVQAAVPLTPNKLYLTGSVGLNTIYARENAEGTPVVSDMRLIPAKVGIQYFPVGRLYVQGEVGTTFLTNKASFDGGKTAAFTVSPQVGYLIPLGKRGNLDAGVRFEQMSRAYTNGETNRFVGFKLGYSYTL